MKVMKKEGSKEKGRKIAIWVLTSFFICLAIIVPHIPAMGQQQITLTGSDFSLSVSNGLEQRRPAQKPIIIRVPEKGVYKDIVIVKLVEDSKIRLRGNTFVSLNPDLSPDLNTSLSSLNDLILRPEVKKVKRLFTRPESELDEEKKRGEKLSRKQLADLNLYYVILLTSGTDPEPILTMLNALDIVEIAYLEPIPEPAILNKNKPSSQTNQMLPPSTTQTELITNGGFESGSTGWVLSGNFYADSRFSYPHSGTGYAYLSNSDGTSGNNLLGSMYQTVTIPSSATSVTLTFWYNITSQETGTTPYDVLNITIQNSTGGYLATVAVYSNVNKDPAPGNPYYHQQPFDMTPYKGQTVRLNFLGTTDSSLPTTFRIDDVSIIATSASTMPTVTTLNASSVTTTSATLNGSVNPNGSATTAWFEWGTSSTLSTYTQTPSQSIGSGTTSQPVSASLSGLIPNTTYYYRAAASNAAGTQRGSILSFTTLSITPTPNFQSQQGYLSNTSTGVHALYSWTLPGGTGIGVKIVDIEGGWQVLHEDFPTYFTSIDGTNNCNTDPKDTDWCQHGTAVIGEMVAKNNGIGVTGIAYDAQYSAVSSLTYSRISNNPSECLNTSECTLISDAINRASNENKISQGDIILIELHAPGPNSGLTCDSNCMVCPPDSRSQFEYIPMEYWPANFDAISTATANGRIVVEAGGNGSMNLDSPIYGGRFDRSLYDSGAILVGAGYSTSRDPHCWTNYGNRIDVQGWGDSVVTTGYGDLFDGGGILIDDPYRYYTDNFSGTSSASPIVAGSAAAIEGRCKNVNGSGVLSPQQMRTLLRNTGTSQGTGGSWGYKQIGPLPNIEAAINSDITFPRVTDFSVTPDSLTLGNPFTISYTVSDTGGSGLKQVELWRAPDSGGIPGTWTKITQTSLPGNGPTSGSFYDTPSSTGSYWYGIHVVDNAGNWNDEKNSNSGNLPGIYGPIKVTVSSQTTPTVTTQPATNVTYNSATINGTITNDGGCSIIERRFDWGMTPDGSGWTNCVSDLSGSYCPPGISVSGNSFSYNFTGLNPNTTYYFRAWAKNCSTQVGCGSVSGWGCGSILSFTTQAPPDTTPPTGSITINSGAAYVASTSVTLTLSCSDSGSGCSQMQFSNDGVTYSSAEAYGTSKSWTLTSGDGTKTVYAKFKDNAGNWSSAYSDTIILDTTSPSTPTGLTATPSGWTNVNSFSTNWTNPSDPSGIAGAYYKLGSAPTSNTDGTYTTSKPFTVSATAQGGQVIYVWLKDGAGNTSYLNRSQTTLYYDATAPTDGTLSATAGNTQVSLSWSGFSDSGSGLRSTDTYKVMRNTGTYPNTQCTNGTQVYLGSGTSKTDTGLTNGQTYYYRACAYDNAGNVSTGATAYATPQASDTTPPTGSISINSGATYTNSTSVTLSISASDPSGVSQMCISNTTSCSSWETYTTSKSWTLSTGDGTKIVYIWFKDGVGNANSSPYSDIIILDTTPPTTTDNSSSTWTSTSPVIVTLSPNDGSGSGVASTKYCVDITNTCAPSITGTSVSVSCASGSECTQYVRYFSIDNVGNPETTKSSNQIRQDRKAPTSGTTFNASAGNAQCSLNWDAATDGGSGLHSTQAYEVRYQAGSDPGSCTGGSQAYIGPGLSYNHSPLTNGTTYYYRLCYKDNVGNQSQFTGNPKTCTPQVSNVSISGYVKTSEGVGISGVTMGGDSCTSTDANGYYSCTVSSGWSGTITPSKGGYSFSPPSRDYNNVTINQTNQDYTGSLITTLYVEPSGICGGNFPCYSTIQDGIDAAGDGATIKVAQGTYYENIYITLSISDLIIQGGWNSTFTSRAEDPSLTIIDGDVTGDGIGDDSVLKIFAVSGFDITVNIEGLTIQNGNGNYGGGIYAATYSSGSIALTLNNNIILNNNVTNYGGGIGAFSQNSGSSTILTLTNNIIAGNAAADNGGGIYAGSQEASNTTLILTNNTIADNTAINNGGGLRAYSYNGGATYITLSNNIIWGNTASNGGDIAIYQPGGTTTVTSSYNDIWDIFNNLGFYNDLGGNINADPLFANPASGDYHLIIGSPCIDMGTNEGAPSSDFEGDIRPFDGDGDTVAITDIGADEYIYSCTLPSTPILISPYNGQTGISTNPTLDWSDVYSANSYDVQVCSDNGCSSVVRSANIVSSQWTVSPALNQGTTYYWRVRANNSCGPGNWSSAWSFTTISTQPTVTITATDAIATEVGPTTGTFTVSRTGSTTSSLTVYYTVSGTATPGKEGDYNKLPGSVIIPSGSATANITVTPIDDTLVESDETVIVTLSSNAAYNIGSPNSATVTIISND